MPRYLRSQDSIVGHITLEIKNQNNQRGMCVDGVGVGRFKMSRRVKWPAKWSQPGKNQPLPALDIFIDQSTLQNNSYRLSVFFEVAFKTESGQ